MHFPATRLRRLRRTASLRDLFRETRLHPAQLVQPYFIVVGEGVAEEIAAMPGQRRLSVDELVKRASRAAQHGVRAALLFGIPAARDELATSGYDPDGPVPRAIRALKAEVPEMVVMADVCCCEYTSHGHCGVVVKGQVDNDRTLEILARMAVVYADAGADVVAPSDMMDGRVRALRGALDAGGHSDTVILSYAVKYASSFYGPFREAAGSTPAFGDRRAYQMDPANAAEALREAGMDVDEGADAIMVKPALPCLDVIARVRERFDEPLAAYQVSGEYAQIRAAARLGWIDEERVIDESLLAIRRAGADVIVTYFAAEWAERHNR